MTEAGEVGALRAELAALRVQRDQMGAALREVGVRCCYLETILRRVRFNYPTQQEPTEQLLAAVDLALASGAPSGPGDRAEKERLHREPDSFGDED